MLRLVLLLLCSSIVSAIDDGDFFQGVNQTSSSSGSADSAGDFTTGTPVDVPLPPLKPLSLSEASVMTSEANLDQIKNYYQRIAQPPKTSPDMRELLETLQAKVRSTQMKDPEALVMLARSFLYYAPRPENRTFLTPMIKMAKQHLKSASRLSTSTSPNARTFALDAKELLQKEFEKGVQIDLQSAKAMQVASRFDEAELYYRLAANKTEFRDPASLKALEDFLRSRAKALGDSDKASDYIAEAELYARMRREGQGTSAVTSKPEPAAPASAASEKPQEEAYTKAEKMSKAGKHEEALGLYKEAVIATQFKDSKARYLLGRQYLRMAAMPQYRSKKDEYESLGRLHLQDVKAGMGAPEDPKNAYWASRARQVDSAISAVTPKTEQEKAVDVLIAEALALNNDRKLAEGLEKLKEAVTRSTEKSAKAQYFLAKQYLLLRAKENDRSKKEGLLKDCRDTLKKSIELANQFQMEYTENQQWATRAKELAQKVDASAASGVDLAGEVSNQGFIVPARGAVTSPYGMRVHPIARTRRMHTGLDVGAPRGAPLKAMANGKIVYAAWMGGYGNTIKIQYDNGYTSMYAHMRNFKQADGSLSANGQRVIQGQVVGQVNSTGQSTGDHLHLELFEGQTRISPAEKIGKRNVRGEQL